ncbi:MAG TPA: sigma-70 family RNA polymerase sigma factor [Blastocatellia bacterium]|nr:sigma-70 family RNA polymerase sigma factor [Blastocatellia bacterium]
MTDDELELWRRCKQGDEIARKELILYYLPLVKLIAGRLFRILYWAEREDLMQEGAVGLIHAVDAFKPEIGNEFTSYARKSIRGAIFRNPEVVRNMTRRQHEIYSKANDTYEALRERLMREPTMEEIVRESGLKQNQILNAFDAINIAFAQGMALENPDVIESRQTAQLPDEQIWIQEIFEHLTEKEHMIFTEFYTAGLTVREIAEKYGMNENTIMTIRKRAVKKIRALVEKKGSNRHDV